METSRPRHAAGASSLLVGRDRECARIDELLGSALAGESGSLIVRGGPGIGKTALLEYAAARAVGMELLTTAGVEAEADLAFAGLYGLLRPILGRMSELPELQAEALAGALGLAPSSGSDRFLASAAVVGLLAEGSVHRGAERAPARSPPGAPSARVSSAAPSLRKPSPTSRRRASKRMRVHAVHEIRVHAHRNPDDQRQSSQRRGQRA